MTGYGVGEAPVGTGRVVVELRAVNHRYLDVRVRAPRELADHLGFLEELARRRLDRGRVDVLARFEGDTGGRVELDRSRARAALEALAALRDELRPSEPLPLSLLACVPDLFVASAATSFDAMRAALEASVGAAVASLDEMRAQEGEALAIDLRQRLARVREHLGAVRGRCPTVVDAYRRRLRERVEQLLSGRAVDVDAGRIEHEVVLFAERMDVAEETTRLESHLAQAESLLSAGSQAVGRRLEFLVQEMGREVNTLGAKCPDAAIVQLVVEIKADLERVREQVQNVL